MASIFDDFEPVSVPSSNEPVSVHRGKKRESLTSAEVTSGKRRLSAMVDRAFDVLSQIVVEADYPTALKAIQIILDRSGFGPKTSLDVTTTSIDLSAMTRDELAARAQQIATTLRTKIEEQKIPSTTIN